MAPWVVLKFGGSSVSRRERWATIAQVTAERRAAGERVLVVCSAVSGVTDLLERAASGERGAFETIADRHATLCAELGLDRRVIAELEASLADHLARAPTGTGAARRAQILAFGELISTTIGAAYLAAQGVAVRWLDARTLLEAVADDAPERIHYLSATCAAVRDRELEARLAAQAESVLVTQGFIARDVRGETVLLGRGGSDTSATLLAAKLGAERCELWSDVPGLYSTNPRLVPSARLLAHLHYEEAEEIALTGAKVLHPRCLGPVWQQGIPLHLRSTEAPHLAGTVIDGQTSSTPPQIKAISLRRGLTLVTIETLGMWQQAGFLAQAFGVFRDHGVSIDLLATSETHVTVSLEPAVNPGLDELLPGLVADLGKFAATTTIGKVAALSLVGRGIRTILARLSSAFEVFQEERLHLMTLAANDLHLALVVDDEQGERLLARLHAHFFDDLRHDDSFGPTWQTQQTGVGAAAGADEAPPWWRERRAELLAIAAAGSPRYVYDLGVVRDATARLVERAGAHRVLYALKANPHPRILAQVAALGAGFECTSLAEVEHVRSVVPGLDARRILFTPSFAPRAEYARAFDLGVNVTLDGIYPLEAWGDLFKGRQVLLRLDPGQGAGHHRFVHTAGEASKFGIPAADLDRALALARACGARIVGLHAHLGSGIRDPRHWQETARFLGGVVARCPDVEIFDVGGGLGVAERPGQPAFDLEKLAGFLRELAANHPGRQIWLEPGRYIVAEAGVLLVRVTQIKTKGTRTFVGVDAGMSSLIRPALYGAYHEIVNLTRLGEPARILADIVGPICESGDVLGHQRVLPHCREGDVLVIATTGAYGHAMGSHYNLRPVADEVILEAR